MIVNVKVARGFLEVADFSTGAVFEEPKAGPPPTLSLGTGDDETIRLVLSDGEHRAEIVFEGRNTEGRNELALFFQRCAARLRGNP